ncbi:unnamed protein product [Arctogadus glacialis]
MEIVLIVPIDHTGGAPQACREPRRKCQKLFLFDCPGSPPRGAAAAAPPVLTCGPQPAFTASTRPEPLHRARLHVPGSSAISPPVRYPPPQLEPPPYTSRSMPRPES